MEINVLHKFTFKGQICAKKIVYINIRGNYDHKTILQCELRQRKLYCYPAAGGFGKGKDAGIDG